MYNSCVMCKYVYYEHHPVDIFMFDIIKCDDTGDTKQAEYTINARNNDTFQRYESSRGQCHLVLSATHNKTMNIFFRIHINIYRK